MPLIHLPEWQSVILCFFVWPVLQTLAAVFCRILPDRFFDPSGFWFQAHRWEASGFIYERLFHVKRWKKFLPDGAAVWKNGYRKKTLRDVSPDNLQRFLIESCRAELTHLLAIPPFILFILFMPLYVLPMMLAYALIVNAPCVIAQRYNRPRVSALLQKKTATQQRSRAKETTI